MGAGLPEKIKFAAKVVLARHIINRAVEAGVPTKWMAADAVYGSGYHCHTAVEGHELASRSARRSAARSARRVGGPSQIAAVMVNL
ncbi:hypothetical protein VT84_29450 [Gemmata sp. SH-PL17]|nr:hypothetical protein VT84_29450 [Gemmata sp. SH-PL17]